MPFTNINKGVLNCVSSLSPIPGHPGRAILQTCLVNKSYLGCFLNLILDYLFEDSSSIEVGPGISTSTPGDF